MTAPDRYTNQPLLKFMELYVLWVIGEISEREEKGMVEMTPFIYESLSQTSGVGQYITPTSTWQEIVAATIGLTDEAPAGIRDLWRRNQEIARQNRVILTPLHFAQMLVDENFRDDDDESDAAGVD